jgi:hypothetical protein
MRVVIQDEAGNSIYSEAFDGYAQARAAALKAPIPKGGKTVQIWSDDLGTRRLMVRSIGLTGDWFTHL